MQNRTTSHLTRNHLTFCYYLFFNQQTLNVLTSLHFTSFSQHLRGLAPRIFVQLTHRSESGLSQVDFNWKSSIEKLQCNFPCAETCGIVKQKVEVENFPLFFFRHLFILLPHPYQRVVDFKIYIQDGVFE